MITEFFKRSVYIVGPINKDSFAKFLTDLAPYLKDESKEVLTVFITSGGGSSSYGFALYDILKSLPFSVNTVAVGFVDSIAIIPFISGDKRFITTQTTFSFHEPTMNQEIRFTLAELGQANHEMNYDYERYTQLIHDHTKIDLSKIKELQAKAITYNANELVTSGIAHEIIPYRS